MRNRFLSILLLPILLTGCSKGQIVSDNSFGVFLGTDSSSINKLSGYQNVAIEIQEFTKSDIDKLKENNTSIYAYLSVGSLENYRPYYDDFKQYTFKEYENWEDESWIDVSIASWQSKLNELATTFKSLGADGLFLDNFDVYYYASEVSEEFAEKNYQGCHQILNNLSRLDLKLLINSGTDFLERLDEENDPLIDKVSWYAQECIFSNIKDYKNNVFSTQNEEDKFYYQSIAKIMKKHSNVLLIEYTRNQSVISDIQSYCKDNGFHYYITDNVDLK